MEGKREGGGEEKKKGKGKENTVPTVYTCTVCGCRITCDSITKFLRGSGRKMWEKRESKEAIVLVGCATSSANLSSSVSAALPLTQLRDVIHKVEVTHTHTLTYIQIHVHVQTHTHAHTHTKLALLSLSLSLPLSPSLSLSLPLSPSLSLSLPLPPSPYLSLSLSLSFSLPLSLPLPPSLSPSPSVPLSQYDTSVVLHRPPLILEGGYSQWYLHYSPVCVGVWKWEGGGEGERGGGGGGSSEGEGVMEVSGSSVDYPTFPEIRYMYSTCTMYICYDIHVMMYIHVHVHVHCTCTMCIIHHEDAHVQ